MTLPHSAQRKRAFLVKTKEKSKSQKQITKNKVPLELLHQRLGHISTRSLMAGYTEMFGKALISGYILTLSTNNIGSPQ